MKTVFKTALAVAILAAGAAYAAEQVTPPQGWTPGWRHQQMIKAQGDGTFTPGQGFGPGMGRGFGPGMMATALGPDGKIDASKLPEGCPMRQALTK